MKGRRKITVREESPRLPRLLFLLSGRSTTWNEIVHGVYKWHQNWPKYCNAQNGISFFFLIEAISLKLRTARKS